MEEDGGSEGGREGGEHVTVWCLVQDKLISYASNILH